MPKEAGAVRRRQHVAVLNQTAVVQQVRVPQVVVVMGLFEKRLDFMESEVRHLFISFCIVLTPMEVMWGKSSSALSDMRAPVSSAPTPGETAPPTPPTPIEVPVVVSAVRVELGWWGSYREDGQLE